MPDGPHTYSELIALFEEFLIWQDPSWSDTPLADVAGGPVHRFPDYGPAAVNERRGEMEEFQARLSTMGVAGWELSRQVDALAVRSRFDREEFLLHVLRPWSRDPGFYVDQMLQIALVDLPVAAADLERLRAYLRAIPVLVDQAMANLSEVAAQFADLAIFKLLTADGVGHGYPHRAEPPPGVLGWYDDLVARTDLDPELQADVIAARTAVARFLRWLKANRPAMTAPAGVGREAFDWYLRYVELMPYSAEDLVLLGQREIRRMWALLALERHKNRELPELWPAESAEDYAERIARTDAHIRGFLVDSEIITIPGYVGELDTTVPWMKRPGGRNFWEEIQFRDPHPDHFHAVIPGHQFDALVERHNDHSIRSRITSPSRTEGWATYLEEAMLNAGSLDSLPRVCELIYIFGIFRAARVPGEVWLQNNDRTVDDVIGYWIDLVPFLDESAARVDAEAYLRRLPGYGIGYTVGALQFQQLLADRKRQLGEGFVLREFHDAIMAAGRLPISLIRWEMTGNDDEIHHLWQREPMPAQAMHPG